MTRRRCAVEHIVGKRENAGIRHFLLFLQGFLHMLHCNDYLTLYDTIPSFNEQEEHPVKNLVGKGENAGIQHFLAHLSTTCSGGAIVTGHRPSSVHPSVRPLTISLKIFSSKTRRPILIKLGRNVPWVKLYKNC